MGRKVPKWIEGANEDFCFFSRYIAYVFCDKDYKVNGLAPELVKG